MVKAFSLPSSSLSYFIGYTLIHSNKIVIISPWLSDIKLRFPVNNKLDDSNLLFSEAVKKLSSKEIYVIVNNDTHNEYILNRLKGYASIIQLESLHAKAVVCDKFVYVGSANVTQSGFFTNIEICEILENDYNSVNKYIFEELNIEIDKEL